MLVGVSVADVAGRSAAPQATSALTAQRARLPRGPPPRQPRRRPSPRSRWPPATRRCPWSALGCWPTAATPSTPRSRWPRSWLVLPGQCGIGGDVFAVVREPDGRVWTVNGSGYGPDGGTAGFYRDRGTAVPLTGALAVAVPGAVAALGTLHAGGHPRAGRAVGPGGRARPARRRLHGEDPPRHRRARRRAARDPGTGRRSFPRRPPAGGRPARPVGPGRVLALVARQTLLQR